MQTESGWSGKEVGKGGGERTHPLFLSVGGNAGGNVTWFVTQLSVCKTERPRACVFSLFPVG